MRLTDHDVQIITRAFRRHFSPDDHLWLFGSRVDPQKKGGDIDLYVETQEKNVHTATNKKLSFVTDLWMQLGEQKIDVVLHLMSSDVHLPIYDIARTEGILLL